ncbi:hypothetical protein WJX81_003444 [Elliptochloris bilobata]|uniref:tRNA (guanine(37)-N1)-methyltransferase n=1 Tax=Elliptochloris bilobata TaxID=381761 RepID=A0AAW1S3Z4_9CHLO
MAAGEQHGVGSASLFDREAFREVLHVQALRIPTRDCQRFMRLMTGYTLDRPKLRCVVSDGDSADTRLLLLSEQLGTEGLGALDEARRALVEEAGLQVVHHDVTVAYPHLTADQVLRRLLPRGTEVPCAFETVGHIAHVNLRDELLPHKRLVGQVLLDKNPAIRTVVNKVGTIENEYRVFAMEVLAGSPCLETEVSQHGARFRLNFAEVYWNSRLESEHKRLVDEFRPGQVVVDVMAGIGPFAIPAAKKGCMVYANDLNPRSHHWLVRNIALNRVASRVQPFCMDGRQFVRLVCGAPLDGSPPADVQQPCVAGQQGAAGSRTRQGLPEGSSIPPGGLRADHFVMNLPASGVEFLDAFRGALRGRRGAPLPMVHCYTFARGCESDADVLLRLEAALGGPLEAPARVTTVCSVLGPMMAFVYYREAEIPEPDALWVTGSALAGAVLGQLLFGYLADWYGRKPVYLHTLLLLIVGTFGAAQSGSHVIGMNFVSWFCVWRFVQGLGLGGDYPIVASITAEYSTRRVRGRMLATVFSAQGLGTLAATLVCWALTAIFKDVRSLDYVWRIALGIGCIPATFTLWLRLKLPESPRYSIQVNRNLPLAAANMQALMGGGYTKDDPGYDHSPAADRISLAAFRRFARRPRNFVALAGTAACWLLVDIPYYTLSSYLPKVLSAMRFIPPASVANPEEVYANVWYTCLGSFVVIGCGLLPGYFVTIATVERLGRRTIQAGSFAVITLLLVVLAAAYAPLLSTPHASAFIVLIVVLFFFCNWGPNATTFILPAEVFPTKFRATCHGISAAAGKIGAVIGAFGYGSLNIKLGLQAMLAILIVPSVLGILFTPLIPEPCGLSLEDAAGGAENSGLEDDAYAAAEAARHAGRRRDASNGSVERHPQVRL